MLAATRAPDLADQLRDAGLIDALAARERLGGDLVLFKRVIDHAQVFLGDWLGGFQAAQRAADREQAMRLAHDLKSISATIGAPALSQAALALERALRAEQPMPAEAELDALLVPVVAELRVALLALSKGVEAHNKATQAPR